MTFFFFFIYLYKKNCNIMPLKKEIIKCDLNGNELCRYGSIREAAKIENISEDKIYKVVNGKQKSADGFIFKKSGVLTNAVDKIGTGKYKCPYCERRFETYNGLCKHVIRQKQHGEITKEQLLTDFKYNGIRPTCKCGCGEYTSIDPNNEAHFCEYVYGHGIRVHNNWGHNKIAQEKSAETRRKQYKEGTRIQWNKGKKWEETYNIETIERLLEIEKSEDRSNKIREKLKGKPKSPEHAEKCRQHCQSEKMRNLLSEKMYERLNSGEFTISSSGETAFIEEFIKPLNIEYKTQYYIKDIKQYCDIYIPSKNLIIEYDGDFWHCNPDIFPDGPKYKYQIKHLEKDRIKNNYCKENNINIIRIWENDAKKNKDIVKNKIFETLK